MVFSEDGLIKLCLHDRATSKVAWVSGVSVTGAMASLDRSLQDGHVEWRRDRAAQKR
jgi:hypothetical protein